MMGAAMGWMWVWPTLTVIGFLILAYLGFRLVQQSTAPPPKTSEPADSTARLILDERFARGEIEEDDYQRRRSLLR
jgi:putative membrane protein